MFNVILSICTSIYWFKHCNVSRGTSFLKAFCRLLTHLSVNYFFALNDYDITIQMSFQFHDRKFAYTSFPIGGFLFVRYGHMAWDFLAIYFRFCWLLISFPLHHFFCIALSSPWLGKRGAGLYVVVCQWACTLKCSHFCVCPFGSMPKVICDSWSLHFIIIHVVL